jgi:uncharacterized membrane protein YdjX (TVP38/TMEM64 family)
MNNGEPFISVNLECLNRPFLSAHFMKKTSAFILALLLISSPFILTLPLKEWVDHSEALRASFGTLGLWAPAAFILLTTLGTAFGLPRLVFCMVAGWLFGFAYGFLWSQLGSLFGAYGLFLLARSSQPERLLRKYPKLRHISTPVGTGWLSVLLVRQLPLAGLYNDILLGWSPVTHRDFWIGSFIGFLPLGITASLLGAGTIEADLGRVAAYFASATLIFFFLSYGIKRLISRKDQSTASSSYPEDPTL